MIVETFPVGQLACNCSILVDPDTGAAVVIDPGADFPTIDARLARHAAKVAVILHTHAHIDHVGATALLQRKTAAIARIHPADRFLYDLLPVQAAMLGTAGPERCEVLEADLAHGGIIRAGAIELGVIHTPGHSPGGVAFRLQTPARALVFTGDTLFRRSIGRTDLWGGDEDAILRSIRERLLTLDDATEVIPGHGPTTTIGQERRSNPYFAHG